MVARTQVWPWKVKGSRRLRPSRVMQRATAKAAATLGAKANLRLIRKRVAARKAAPVVIQPQTRRVSLRQSVRQYVTHIFQMVVAVALVTWGFVASRVAARLSPDQSATATAVRMASLGATFAAIGVLLTPS